MLFDPSQGSDLTIDQLNIDSPKYQQHRPYPKITLRIFSKYTHKLELLYLRATNAFQQRIGSALHGFSLIFDLKQAQTKITQI